MLGVDELTQERWRQETARETAAQRRQRILEDEIRSHCVTVAPDAGYDITQLEAQLGKPLLACEVMRRLKLCNSNLHFERANADPTLWGVYLLTRELKDGMWQNVKKHICALGTDGIMPEFTVIHTKKVHVPRNELFGNKKPTREVDWDYIETYADQTRGWRVPLIRLLRARIITEADVTRHFGWVPSRQSKKWHELTH